VQDLLLRNKQKNAMRTLAANKQTPFTTAIAVAKWADRNTDQESWEGLLATRTASELFKLVDFHGGYITALMHRHFPAMRDVHYRWGYTSSLRDGLLVEKIAARAVENDEVELAWQQAGQRSWFGLHRALAVRMAAKPGSAMWLIDHLATLEDVDLRTSVLLNVWQSECDLDTLTRAAVANSDLFNDKSCMSKWDRSSIHEFNHEQLSALLATGNPYLTRRAASAIAVLCEPIDEDLTAAFYQAAVNDQSVVECFVNGLESPEDGAPALTILKALGVDRLSRILEACPPPFSERQARLLYNYLPGQLTDQAMANLLTRCPHSVVVKWLVGSEKIEPNLNTVELLAKQYSRTGPGLFRSLSSSWLAPDEGKELSVPVLLAAIFAAAGGELPETQAALDVFSHTAVSVVRTRPEQWAPVIEKVLRQHLGSDIDAWRAALSMMDTWTGSILELATTVAMTSSF